MTVLFSNPAIGRLDGTISEVGLLTGAREGDWT